jgi:hypothetical protein
MLQHNIILGATWFNVCYSTANMPIILGATWLNVCDSTTDMPIILGATWLNYATGQQACMYLGK